MKNKEYIGSDMMPLTSSEFLKDIVDVYKKHKLCISHQDFHGAFIIEPYNEYFVNWLNQADTHTVDDFKVKSEDDHKVIKNRVNEFVDMCVSCGKYVESFFNLTDEHILKVEDIIDRYNDKTAKTKIRKLIMEIYNEKCNS